MREGFTNNLAFLSRKDDKYVSKVASSIRKQGGVVAGLMTVNLEETLTTLCQVDQVHPVDSKELGICSSYT